MLRDVATAAQDWQNIRQKLSSKMAMSTVTNQPCNGANSNRCLS